MPDLTRRSLLAGAAATTVLAATASRAQSDMIAAAAPDLAGKAILITGTSSGFGRLGAIVGADVGAAVTRVQVCGIEELVK